MTKKWLRNDLEMSENDRECLKMTENVWKWERNEQEWMGNIIHDYLWFISPVLICHSWMADNEML